MSCTSAVSTEAAASIVVCNGGTPSSTATSPNCKSESTMQTLWPFTASAAAVFVDTTLLPTPPFVEKDTMTRPRLAASCTTTRFAMVAIASPTRSTVCRSVASSASSVTASRTPARNACCRSGNVSSSASNTIPTFG
jgi:hypothetical protein